MRFFCVASILFMIVFAVGAKDSLSLRGGGGGGEQTLSDSTTNSDKEVLYSMDPIPTVYIFANKKKGSRFYSRKALRLMSIIAKVYPIAQEARYTLGVMERELLALDSESEQKKYVKSVEKQLKDKYKPILLTMTTTEGFILLKLIDRQTGDTSYELVRELRGNFSAFFWQGIARIFGVNLKSEYNSAGDDWILEQYILEYEKSIK